MKGNTFIKENYQITLKIIATILSLVLLFVLFSKLNKVYIFNWHINFGRWVNDNNLVAWFGLVVNIGTTIFINILLVLFRRPKFQVTSGKTRPWQVEKSLSTSNDFQLLHVRLKIKNIGRSFEEACEVRIEQVLKIFSNEIKNAEIIDIHDPRPLKWVGRDTKPINLNYKAFDYVDLGVRNKDSPESFRLDFAERGHLDLWINEQDLVSFRIIGTVYGKRSNPKAFEFDLKWEPFEFGPVVLIKI